VLPEVTLTLNCSVSDDKHQVNKVKNEVVQGEVALVTLHFESPCALTHWRKYFNIQPFSKRKKKISEHVESKTGK
jgi:hypothetical protein